MYSYSRTIKSNKSDELINTYFFRPIAGLIVWVFYYTPVTPNQVTIASVITGLSAALFYLKGTSEAFVIAGLLVTLKDVLDAADGQLARAKQLYSRIGRFLDSIGDFIVNAAVFGAIGWTLYLSSGNGSMFILAVLGFFCISLRVSYHVYYQVCFLHLQNQYTVNRITEEVRDEDLKIDKLELTLQRLFQLIYGWQDRLMIRIDRWSQPYTQRVVSENLINESSEAHSIWYADDIALRLSSFLGFGTELFLLMLCSVFNRLELYLYLNLFFMNGILALCIWYRRSVLSRKLRRDVIK